MKPTGEVHPAAAAWPMLPADELRELADSITANGLRQPIVRTPDGQILDGRNRLAACKLAKVKPTFVVHDGDPVAYVLDANQYRRHMSKGQRAMSAWVTASTSADSSGITTRDLAANHDIAQSEAAKAKVVAEHAPDLVANVTNGATSLKDAYDVARKRRSDADSNEAKLAKLDDSAPDLAAQVREETLELTEAIAAANARDEREKADAAARHDARQQFNWSVGNSLFLLSALADVPEHVTDFAVNYGPPAPALTTDDLKAVARTLDQLINEWSHP